MARHGGAVLPCRLAKRNDRAAAAAQARGVVVCHAAALDVRPKDQMGVCTEDGPCV